MAEIRRGEDGRSLKVKLACQTLIAIGELVMEGLLPGEDPSSEFPEDVQHWAAVYAELLQSADDVSARVSGLGGDELADESASVAIDRTALSARLNHLRQRHEFWMSRLPAGSDEAAKA